MSTKLKAPKIGSDVSANIVREAKCVESRNIETKKLITDEIKEASAYVGPMVDAKKRYKELKKQIKIGSAMVRAAEGSSASKKSKAKTAAAAKTKDS